MTPLMEKANKCRVVFKQHINLDLAVLCRSVPRGSLGINTFFVYLCF